VAVLLSRQPLPRGPRVAVLTNGGGLGILCADACEAVGLELPAPSEETRATLAPMLPREASLANPIDMLGSATGATYETVIPHLLADPCFDALIVLFTPPVVADAEEVGEAVVRAMRAQPQNGKPVLASFVCAGGAPACLVESDPPVATFAYPESAARALGRAVTRAEWLRRPAGTFPELDGIDRPAAEALIAEVVESSNDAWLTASQVRTLFDTYGIRLVPERVVVDVDDAVEAARELGFPVVVKTAAAGAHKTETGGIALDLAGEDDVRAAVERIGLPVLVQPMVKGGVELLAGVVEDPVFGPLVAFGPGGVFTELIGEAQFRLAPLTDLDAEELVTTGKAGRLVRGFRGAPPANEVALMDLVLRLASLADDIPEIAELDLNPVIAFPEGCVAVDARVRVRPAERLPRAKTW
jgi:acyl-CoA synthetase (NDP forming)